MTEHDKKVGFKTTGVEPAVVAPAIRPIELPKPTPDQAAYLETLRTALSARDLDVVIGGPRVEQS